MLKINKILLTINAVVIALAISFMAVQRISNHQAIYNSYKIRRLEYSLLNYERLATYNPENIELRQKIHRLSKSVENEYAIKEEKRWIE